MNRYIDTSALIPYYRPEPLSAACEAVLLSDRSGTDELLLSELTLAEVSSSLARLVRMRVLDREAAIRIEQRLDEHITQGNFRVLPVERRHYADARARLRQGATALRTLDALHLSIVHDCNAELVTADRNLSMAAQHYQMPVVLISQ